jgi:putative endonuclease
MSFIVYIIKSREGRRYTGHTPDLNRRLAEHNGHLSHSTKHGTGWEVIYTESFATRSEAMKREKYFKTGKGRNEVNQLIAGWSPPEAE